MLSEANLSLDQCGVALKTSVVILRRRLAAEGTSYRQIRRRAIITKAKTYLARGDPADDVAVHLGYSDARSLRRALKLAGGGCIEDLRQSEEKMNH